MFEKRSIWGIIVGLNVCILIWLISVQEPVIFDVNTSAISSGSSSSSSKNFIINAVSAAQDGTTGGGRGRGEGAAVRGGVKRGLNNVWGRDLLSKPDLAVQNHEYMNDDDSTLTTLNNIKKNNRNYNLTTMTTTTTTTKTSDLSSDMQSLTSSLGTGILALITKPTPSWSKLMTAAAASALPNEDFNQLIDLYDFQFLMLQPVCGNHIEALILIHSAPKNYEKRQLIRETWASITHNIIESPLRILFSLGAVTSKELEQELQEENNFYRDIIQGSFIDDYRNMTYKHIMAFKWFLYNCPQAQILIKVDDDVYVNTPQLIEYLKEEKLRTKQRQQQQYKQRQQQQHHHQQMLEEKENPTIATKKETSNVNVNATQSTAKATATTSTSIFQTLNIFSSLFQSSGSASSKESSSSSSSSSTVTATATSNTASTFNASQELFNHPQNLLFCQKIIGAMAKRSYRSKWRVSFKEYSEPYYPPYCPGYAIIYSPDVIFRLYLAAQKSKYFWIDDVHITGVLAQQTNTTITTSSHYVLYSDECDQILTGKTDLSKMEFLFAWHSISAQKIKLLWHLQMMSPLQVQNAIQYHQVLYEMRQEQQKRINNDIDDKYTSSTNGLR